MTERADKFVEAIANGAEVFAAPETARVIGEFLPVKPCEWMQEGSLYAIDMGRYELSPEMGFQGSHSKNEDFSGGDIDYGNQCE